MTDLIDTLIAGIQEDAAKLVEQRTFTPPLLAAAIRSAPLSPATEEKIAAVRREIPSWAEELHKTVKRVFPSECVDPSSVIEAAGRERDTLAARVETAEAVVVALKRVLNCGDPIDHQNRGAAMIAMPLLTDALAAYDAARQPEAASEGEESE